MNDCFFFLSEILFCSNKPLNSVEIIYIKLKHIQNSNSVFTHCYAESFSSFKYILLHFFPLKTYLIAAHPKRTASPKKKKKSLGLAKQKNMSHFSVTSLNLLKCSVPAEPSHVMQSTDQVSWHRNIDFLWVGEIQVIHDIYKLLQALG